MSTHLTAVCCLAKEIFIDFMVYRQPFPVLPNLEKWPWSSPSPFFPLILHSPNYSKPLYLHLPRILNSRGKNVTHHSTFVLLQNLSICSTDLPHYHRASETNGKMLSGWWQPRRKSLLMVRTAICWWHLTSFTMHLVKYSCTPCCVLDIITGSSLSQVAWSCSPCHNHCHGWLKNTLSYFWRGEYKKEL